MKPSPSRRGLLAGFGAMAVGGLFAPALAAQALAPGAGSLADLRRLPPPEGGAGPLYVSGAREPGDGGGGWFAWRPGSSAADDGGCVLAPEAGGATGRWHRLFNGPVDARWFGARGDGAADDSDALQRAVDHYPDIYLPAGVYRLTRPLDLTEAWGRRLTGAGQTVDPRSPNGFDDGRLSRGTALLLDADDAPVLRLAGSGHLVERLCLMARTRQPRAAAKSYGIELNAVARSRLSDLRIFNCATGIGLPQRPAPRDRRSNFLFDSAIANVDINDFAFCGLDLRNYEAGGTGTTISQIYMSNMAGGTQLDPQLREAQHFILGHNWAEYVLSAVHCEWTRLRDDAIRLHNCNATIQGLHIEGVRFADSAEAVIRLEGGTTGLTLDATTLYECRVEGGPSAPPLPLLATSAKIARVAIKHVALSRTLRSNGGRKFTTARLIGGDAKVDVSGLLQESDIYAAPIMARGLAQRD